MKSKLHTAGWVILALVGALIVLGGLASARVAYTQASDPIVSGTTLVDVAAGREDVATALRARRGTAAAYAAGYGVMLLAVALGPFRRGDRWAFFAVLASALTLAGLTLLRVPLLGSRAGARTGLVQLGVVAVALLLGSGRMLSARE